MSKKQIIIDGVDIKDCKRRIGKDNFCRYYKRPCAENNYNCIWKKYLRKEQECEELKKELQAQRAFTRHEQKLIYCVAYDETCKTGNDCKQKKCIFKDDIKLKQTLTDIEFWVREFLKRTGQVVPNEIKQILQKISECEVENVR